MIYNKKMEERDGGIILIMAMTRYFRGSTGESSYIIYFSALWIGENNGRNLLHAS